MKFWSSSYVFEHKWEDVCQAVWKKYPNKFNKNILGIDVLDRQICESKESHYLYTHRLITSQWVIPRWISFGILTAPNFMYANEWSEVDVKQKKMILRTRNITFCKYISVDEVLVYEPHENDENKTVLRQEANVVVDGVPFSHYMETYLTQSISSNSKKGHMAMDWVLETMQELKHDIEEITESAKKSTDELQNVAKKSLSGCLTTGMDKKPNKTPP